MYLPISRCISPQLAISPQAERRSELEDAAQLADQIEDLVAEVTAQQAHGGPPLTLTLTRRSSS